MAKSGADDPKVAQTLSRLGVCVRESERLGEAEEMFWQALEIQEARLGANDLNVAYTLHQLGVCVLKMGRPRGAEELLKRAKEIKETQLGGGTSARCRDAARDGFVFGGGGAMREGSRGVSAGSGDHQRRCWG